MTRDSTQAIAPAYPVAPPTKLDEGGLSPVWLDAVQEVLARAFATRAFKFPRGL